MLLQITIRLDDARAIDFSIGREQKRKKKKENNDHVQPYV